MLHFLKALRLQEKFLVLQVGTFATNIKSGQFFSSELEHTAGLITLEAKKIKQRQSRWNKSFSLLDPGWQKLCRGTGGPRRKVWTRTKILSPNIGYFVANSRFVAIYALFGRLWTKSVVLGPKQCFMVKKCIIIWYIYYITVK